MNNLTKPFDGVPEAKAFEMIIDSYRLCVEDEYKFRGDARGLCGDMPPRPDFLRYLRKAEQKGGILPAWWSPDKKKECVEMAGNRASWSSLESPVEKSDATEHYGNPMMPMQLRMVAEQIEGSNVMAF